MHIKYSVKTCFTNLYLQENLNRFDRLEFHSVYFHRCVIQVFAVLQMQYALSESDYICPEKVSIVIESVNYEVLHERVKMQHKQNGV